MCGKWIKAVCAELAVVPTDLSTLQTDALSLPKSYVNVN